MAGFGATPGNYGVVRVGSDVFSWGRIVGLGSRYIFRFRIFDK